MDDTALPITDHLAELRNRIFKILAAWVVGAGLAWSFSEQIFSYLLAPAVAALGPEGGQLQAIAPKLDLRRVQRRVVEAWRLVWMWVLPNYGHPARYCLSVQCPCTAT